MYDSKIIFSSGYSYPQYHWYPTALIVTSTFGIVSCLYKILNDGTAITIKIKHGINVHKTSTATLWVVFDGLGFFDALNLMQV